MAYDSSYNVSDPAQVKAVRENIRNSIFTSKPKSKVIEVFGTKIEIRQPSLKAILDNQIASEEDRAGAAARMLIKYAFVPGSTERVFEDVDVDSILGLPFGDDMQKVQNAINELTNVQDAVEAAKGN